MGVNKVVFGDQTIIDITDSTVNPENVIENNVFYDTSGTRQVGTLGDATTENHGLMSAADKAKLDEFQDASNYITEHQDISGKADSADLAAVATSGSYTDLTDKPFIPSNVSDLTNDAGYLTQHQDISGKANSADLATVATSGSYTDLLNKPAIPTKVSDLTDDSGHYTKPAGGIPAEDLAETYLTQHQDISGKANSADLATVATSGSYNDLLDKPTIPTSVSQLTNDSGYLTSYTETDPTVPSWAKAVNKPSYTASEVGAPTVSEMNTAIATAIGNVHQFGIEVVQELPTTNIKEHTVYFIPKTGETNDIYDEYIRVNDGWEMIGNTQIDLSNYATKSEIPDTSIYVTKTSINDAGIVNQTYSTQFNGEFTVSTAVNENYISPYVRAAITGKLDKDYLYRVTFNGTTYILPVKLWFDQLGQQSTHGHDVRIYEYIGNIGLYIDDTSSIIDEFYNVPFVIIANRNQMDSIDILTETSGTYTVLVEKIIQNYKQLPLSLMYGSEYYPINIRKFSTILEPISIGINEMSENIRGSYAIGVGNRIQNNYSFAIGTINLVSGMLSSAIGRDNTVSGDYACAVGNETTASGDSSFSCGEETVASGRASHSEGGSTLASGNHSHAEGNNTRATLDAAHAEGINTVAAGPYSHVEGNASSTSSTAVASHAEGGANQANGNYAHAEGQQNVASGAYSHAEGRQNTVTSTGGHVEGRANEVSGHYAHAEGNGTNASGAMSHAEGSNTIANHRSQHVFGEYNILDSSSSTTIELGNYIEIIGNGTADNDRSNARALDWNGNEYLKGNIYVNCNTDSTGGEKLVNGLKVVRLI